MPTLKDTVDAFLASREYDRATRSRLAFWVEQFGERDLLDISADDVDAALVRLAERGCLKPARHRRAQRAGKPLGPGTINRYISQLGSIYRYARRLRLIPRNFVSPTLGIERERE
ncbi:MAG: site-specific integrase, partial [Gammaproteobacteria bacterium]